MAQVTPGRRCGGGRLGVFFQERRLERDAHRRRRHGVHPVVAGGARSGVGGEGRVARIFRRAAARAHELPERSPHRQAHGRDRVRGEREKRRHHIPQRRPRAFRRGRASLRQCVQGAHQPHHGNVRGARQEVWVVEPSKQAPQARQQRGEVGVRRQMPRRRKQRLGGATANVVVLVVERRRRGGEGRREQAGRERVARGQHVSQREQRAVPHLPFRPAEQHQYAGDDRLDGVRRERQQAGT